MQGSFPVLTYLNLAIPLSDSDSSVVILPGGFSGGSVSSLQDISLSRISFPALPSLLSASDLVHLNWHLDNGFPLEAMVTGLAAATRLTGLSIVYHLLAPLPHQRFVTPSPPTRAVLPALTQFRFEGDYNYLEDLVAQLDCPRLKTIIVLYFDDAMFFNQVIDVYMTQLIQFVERVGDLNLARVCRTRSLILITLP